MTLNRDQTRRRLLKSSALTVLAAKIPLISAHAASAPTRKTNIQIVDISQGPFYGNAVCMDPKRDYFRALADHGVNTIIRYYSTKDNLPCKTITPRERAIVHSYGFNLAIVYQYDGRRPGRYTAATGKEDAEFCLGKAKAIRQPNDSAIFFGVDADTAIHNPEGVIQYFKQLQKTFDGRFRIGCYGAGANCSAVLNEGLASLTWVAEAPAWTGTRNFMNSGKWTLYQNKSRVKSNAMTKGHRVEIDTNILNPEFDTIGAFDQDGTIVKYKKEALKLIADSRKWVNIDTVLLRDKPNGRAVRHICIARTVHVLAALDNDWVLVDIDEDGQADGCCEAKYLVPLSNMPQWSNACIPMEI